MKKLANVSTLMLFAVAAMASLSACRAGAKYQVTGRVYDGLNGVPVTAYTASLTWGDQSIAARIVDGRYIFDGVPSLADFQVTITADTFQPFLANVNALADTGSGTRVELVSPTLNVDAVLMPALPAPASQINVFLPDTTTRPSGTVRLAPQTATAFTFVDGDVSNTIAAGNTSTNARRLTNTLASYRPTITKTFENGVISFAEGELSLGVTYDLLVTGVNGYATVNNWTYQAGFDGNPTFFLERLTGVAGAPAILYTNFAGVTENVTADGSLVIAFDRDVELVLEQAGTIAVLNDLINDTLEAQDEAGNIPTNQAGMGMTDTGTGLVPNTAINQHGVSVTVTGSVLTIRWSGNANLAAPDMGETPANRICYGALANVRVRATGTTGAGTDITNVAVNGDAQANGFSNPGGTECIRFRASQAAATPVP